ncbi:MAG: nucleotidyltransferase domain-containing protein [Candidatus Rokubacteria bacterium]|nr:nucleotidyltransferase domain-containing protein [Candidatus Rokubacteria bacterium]
MLGALRQIAAGIGARHPEVREVRLYGSLARGERNPYADADLLIVVDASDLPLRDRGPCYKPAGSPVPMDLTVCTRVELEREAAAGNAFVRRVLAESLVLYARAATQGATRAGCRGAGGGP